MRTYSGILNCQPTLHTMKMWTSRKRSKKCLEVVWLPVSWKYLRSVFELYVNLRKKKKMESVLFFKKHHNNNIMFTYIVRQQRQMTVGHQRFLYGKKEQYSMILCVLIWVCNLGVNRQHSTKCRDMKKENKNNKTSPWSKLTQDKVSSISVHLLYILL